MDTRHLSNGNNHISSATLPSLTEKLRSLPFAISRDIPPNPACFQVQRNSGPNGGTLTKALWETPSKRLGEYCEILGVGTAGTKADLVARLGTHLSSNGHPQNRTQSSTKPVFLIQRVPLALKPVQCICEGEKISELIQCSKCKVYQHAGCVNTTIVPYECPSCILIKTDPLLKIDSKNFLLGPLKASNVPVGKSFTFSGTYLHLVIAKLGGSTSPGSFELSLNGFVVPFSSDRRSLRLTKEIGLVEGRNNIAVFHTCPEALFAYAVVEAQEISVHEYMNKVLSNNRPSIEASIRFLTAKLKLHPLPYLLPVDKIVMLRVPVHGKTCKHLEPIDLYEFVQRAGATKNWNCPYCDQPCTELVVDTYLESVLKALKEQMVYIHKICVTVKGDYIINDTIHASFSQSQITLSELPMTAPTVFKISEVPKYVQDYQHHNSKHKIFKLEQQPPVKEPAKPLFQLTKVPAPVRPRLFDVKTVLPPAPSNTFTFYDYFRNMFSGFPGDMFAGRQQTLPVPWMNYPQPACLNPPPQSFVAPIPRPNGKLPALAQFIKPSATPVFECKYSAAEVEKPKIKKELESLCSGIDQVSKYVLTSKEGEEESKSRKIREKCQRVPKNLGKEPEKALKHWISFDSFMGKVAGAKKRHKRREKQKEAEFDAVLDQAVSDTGFEAISKEFVQESRKDAPGEIAVEGWVAVARGDLPKKRKHITHAWNKEHRPKKIFNVDSCLANPSQNA